MEEYTCSKCGQSKPRSEFHETKHSDRLRPVTSRCKACRSEARYEKKYKDSVCTTCGAPRKLDADGKCLQCSSGTLKRCRQCGETLLLLVYFNQNQAICKACQKELYRLRRDAER